MTVAVQKSARLQPSEAPASEWPIIRLRFHLKINPSKSEVSHLPGDTQVSFVPMEAVSEYGGLRLDQTKALEDVGTGYTYFREGDVLVAKITPCFENGKGSIAENLEGGFGFGTTELHVLRPQGQLDNRFLFYLTISHAFRNVGASWMYGAGGQKRIPDDFIRDFRQPMPPIKTQRSIAEYLDQETARIDVLITKKQRQIELLQEKRIALISNAVTKGLNPSAKMKDSGIDWLGKVPEHWEVKLLKRIASLRSGASITSSDIHEEGDYPVYGGNGLRGYTNSFTHQGYFALIGRQGALCGCINYAEGKFWASEHAVVVTPRADIQTKWLGELLRAMDLNRFSQSAAQPGLSVDMISALHLPVPPPNEQRDIADYISFESAKIKSLSEKILTSENVLQEYRSALISDTVTGNFKFEN